MKKKKRRSDEKRLTAITHDVMQKDYFGIYRRMELSVECSELKGEKRNLLQRYP